MIHTSIETCLTPNEVKASVFARDTDYVAALDDIRHSWTSDRSLCGLLWSTASLILRPDAIAGGQAANILPVLRELGFIPVAAATVRFSLAQTRALWRYQANVSTKERLRLLDLIMTSGHSLYVLFRDVTHRLSAPATVHLTYLKGTAIVSNRRRWHMRTLAGPKLASILSYVHVSDDPADLLREAALLFPKRRWLNLMKQAEQALDRTDFVRSLIVSLQAEIPKELLAYSDLNPQTGTGALVIPGNRVLNTEGLLLNEAEIHQRWHYIIEQSLNCKVFVNGNSYDGRTATVPDDKNLSLPLDGRFVFPELGPR